MPHTVKLWLSATTNQLKNVGISSARLDALVLLEAATGKDRSTLLAYPELVLNASSLQKLNEQVERRAKHEPLAYIRGKSEFYGQEFLVTTDTLQPRPETETIINLLKKLVSTPERVRPLHIVDVGTGSGCLAITAKLEIPGAVVVGTDISAACLKVARENAKKLDADVTFCQGNLLEALPPSGNMPTITITNLPYVPNDHTINQAAMFEPKMAIFGGADGLDLYRQLFLQIATLSQFDSKKPVFVLAESLPFQHTELTQIAMSAGYKLKMSEDFIQVFELT